MLSYNDLKSGIFFIYEGQPYEVLESNQLKMQQRRPVFQTRMRNLLNGKIIENNFQQSDMLEEADVDRKDVKFLYSSPRRLPAGSQEYWFAERNDASKRFKLEAGLLGDSARFLKPNLEMEAILFEGTIIRVELPIKMEFKVTEAPPAIRGNTAQGGVKSATIETGASINVPLFINEGDTIRINTQTGEYVERIAKQ